MHRSGAVLLCLGFRLQKRDARCILLCFNRSRNEVLGTFHRARLLHKSSAGCLNLCVILLWVLLLWAWMTEVRPLGFLQWGQLLEGAQSHHDGFSSKPSLLLNRKCLLLLPLQQLLFWCGGAPADWFVGYLPFFWRPVMQSSMPPSDSGGCSTHHSAVLRNIQRRERQQSR